MLASVRRAIATAIRGSRARRLKIFMRLQILMGRDEMLLGALATGVKGAVGSTYNYAAPVYQRIRAAVASGNFDAAVEANVEAVKERAGDPLSVLLDRGMRATTRALG